MFVYQTLLESEILIIHYDNEDYNLSLIHI